MAVDWKAVKKDVVHRPWPLPKRSWVMTMSWRELLAAHWPVDADLLRATLPEGLELDTYDSKGWLSVVPFEMDNVAPRGLTWWPKPYRFLELNLRTYVTVAGDKPGVFFYSLDAESALTVWGARRFFYLPYFDAEMSLQHSEEWVHYGSRRTHRGAAPGVFRARYRPSGPVLSVKEGSFDRWVMERYCLYSARPDGKVFRCDVHHEPWRLRPAEVEIETNTIAAPLAIELSPEPAVAHFAKEIHVLGWSLEEV